MFESMFGSHLSGLELAQAIAGIDGILANKDADLASGVTLQENIDEIERVRSQLSDTLHRAIGHAELVSELGSIEPVPEVTAVIDGDWASVALPESPVEPRMGGSYSVHIPIGDKTIFLATGSFGPGQGGYSIGPVIR